MIIESVVNLTVTWLGFVFVSILFIHMHGIICRGEVGLKLGIKGQDSERISDLDG